MIRGLGLGVWNSSGQGLVKLDNNILHQGFVD